MNIFFRTRGVNPTYSQEIILAAVNSRSKLEMLLIIILLCISRVIKCTKILMFRQVFKLCYIIITRPQHWSLEYNKVVTFIVIECCSVIDDYFSSFIKNIKINYPCCVLHFMSQFLYFTSKHRHLHPGHKILI